MFLTEIVQAVEDLSVFDKISQILWGGYFNWKDLFDFVIAVVEVLVIAWGMLIWIPNRLLKASAPYKAYKEDIDAVLGKKTRKMIEKYYIPTRGQDVDPCNEEEIRENNGKYNTEKLIPFLVKKAFAEDSFGKHYIILADAGMGKTTLLVNLYRYYVLKKRFWSRDRKNIRYIPLSAENCMEQIQAIENQSKTILLLDALDESKAAIMDCSNFLNELLQQTQSFYKVVVTCRTHFFSDVKSEPKYTGLIRPGTGDKNLNFTKKYISPFSDKEVNAYLRKRFLLRFTSQRKGREIIKQVPEIMARPLILNWIDYLVDTDEKLHSSFEIYKTIIDKWIQREPESLTKGKLFELSRKIAKWMLDNESTYVPAAVVDVMASEEGIKLLPIVAKSRSLLNRNSNGIYKFAHRSFLEWFLSELVYNEGVPVGKEQYLCKMSAFGRFLVEQLENKLLTVRYMLTVQRGLRNYKVVIPFGSTVGITTSKDELLRKVCHYSFRMYRKYLGDDGFTERDTFGIEVIYVVQYDRDVYLYRFDCARYARVNAGKEHKAWCFYPKPMMKRIPQEFYMQVADSNFGTPKYAYTTPLLMDALFPEGPE